MALWRVHYRDGKRSVPMPNAVAADYLDVFKGEKMVREGWWAWEVRYGSFFHKLMEFF